MNNTAKESNGNDMQYLIKNYENLHQAIWENHKTSWVVTGIYLPIIFTAQGYLIKLFFGKSKEFGEELGTFVVIGAVGIIFATLIWWTIMEIFCKYNRVRIKRLRDIEEIVSRGIINKDDILFRQYNLHYTPRIKLFERKILNYPQTEFIPDRKKGVIPLNIKFCNGSVNANEYEWDFGDGTYMKGAKSPTHTYNYPGNYTVNLTCSNECGNSYKEMKIKALDSHYRINWKVTFRMLYASIFLVITITNLILIFVNVQI